jgi:hypothetical protein
MLLIATIINNIYIIQHNQKPRFHKGNGVYLLTNTCLLLSISRFPLVLCHAKDIGLVLDILHPHQ